MGKQREQVTNAEAWSRTMQALQQQKDAIADQLPKGLKEFPELVGGLILTAGFLAHQIVTARRRIAAGLPIDLPSQEDLRTWCSMPPEVCECISTGNWGNCMPPDLPDIPGTLRPPGIFRTRLCREVIEEYRTALEEVQACLANIDPDLPLADKVAEVERCLAIEEQAKQVAIDNGCWCDYLEEELDAALSAEPVDWSLVGEIRDKIREAGCV
jgi:hypothetical protein